VALAPRDVEPIVLVNPVIVERSDETDLALEGCLSLPGIQVEVQRAVSVSVSAQNLVGASLAFDLDGIAARVLQHELDHLNGVLILDHATISDRRRVMPNLCGL
jgi:peptide deformylase